MFLASIVTRFAYNYIVRGFVTMKMDQFQLNIIFSSPFVVKIDKIPYSLPYQAGFAVLESTVTWL